MKRRAFVPFSLFMIMFMVLTSCATPTPQTIIQTVEVKSTVEVPVTQEVQVTHDVEVTKEVVVETKLAPLFWDADKKSLRQDSETDCEHAWRLPVPQPGCLVRGRRASEPVDAAPTLRASRNDPCPTGDFAQHQRGPLDRGQQR
jgi:hypothetical protein